MTKRPPKAGNPDIKVFKIHDSKQLEQAHHIRYEVFVIGQNVPAQEEIDKFESVSTHFLATHQQEPAGAARWRTTPKGIKLERFAVLEQFRGMGIGSALVQAVLDDIYSTKPSDNTLLYLHAQLGAMALYEKFGFNKVGEIFRECDIEHYEMVLK